jgi:hypothetical protein
MKIVIFIDLFFSFYTCTHTRWGGNGGPFMNRPRPVGGGCRCQYTDVRTPLFGSLLRKWTYKLYYNNVS